MTTVPTRDDPPLDLATVLADSNVESLLATLDRELVGLAPVKTRIREIAALLLVEKLRARSACRPDRRRCT